MRYANIYRHYENCLEQFGDTHQGVDWPNEEDAHKRYEVMLDVINNTEQISLLDFGCGASHMFEYMERHKKNEKVQYFGLDISEKFIELSRKKHPQNRYFCQDILIQNDIPHFDYIILNGVFTEKRDLTFDEMWDFTKQILSKIFSKTNIGIAFNVMSKQVDWERDDLFHLPHDLLCEFMTKELSRNYIIRNDYGLYEYTTYLYK